MLPVPEQHALKAGLDEMTPEIKWYRTEMSGHALASFQDPTSLHRCPQDAVLGHPRCFHFFVFTLGADPASRNLNMCALSKDTGLVMQCLKAYLFVLFKILCHSYSRIIRAIFSSSIRRIKIGFFFLLPRLSLKSYPLNIPIYSAWRSWYECLKILRSWVIRWPK